MSRKASLSGFHEWLPAERLVEQHVLDTFRQLSPAWQRVMSAYITYVKFLHQSGEEFDEKLRFDRFWGARDGR